MLPAPSQSVSSQPASAQGEPAAGVLISSEGRVLPLLGTSLRVQAHNGLARVVLEQRFRNVHDVPLQVTYSFPLPADGAVSEFAFRLGERRIVGEIERREVARERFEEAILEGKSAALLEQDRSSLFTQELGNIPPGAEVVAEIGIDQRLRWLPDGAWEWRFPTAVAPRYLGAAGRVPDAQRLSPEISAEALSPRLLLALEIRDALASGGAPESPSHALSVAALGDIRLREPEGVALDRDLVVRWAVARDAIGAAIETARRPQGAVLGSTAYGLLTLVPPRASEGQVARDVVILIDTSGSMAGEPLAQACRVISALVETLGESDRLEMIQFSWAPRRWKRSPQAVTAGVRREALRWLASLRASGGTEMRDGILEALRPRRTDSQRQVILVTDGFIGFESEVVAAILRRDTTTRVHSLGVGSAVNRSLTAAAARAGGGLELIVGLGEDVERAARRLVACTNAPLVVDLEVTGSAFVAHAGLPDLFGGMPALIPLALRPEGGELLVRGRSASGRWEQRLGIGNIEPGSGREAVVALFGREQVEALEARVAGGESSLDPQIERLGLDFRIATRLTSWVAISERASVDPRSPIRRERMPQQLPHGVSAEAVGLRPALAAAPMLASFAMPSAMPPAMPSAMPMRSALAFGERARFGRGAPPPAPAPKGKPEQAAPVQGAPERSLRGSVARRGEREIVFEIEIDSLELAWEPPLRVEIEWTDGTFAELEVIRERTTASGTLRPGERARLGVALGAAHVGRAPSLLRASLPAARLRVTL